MSTKTSSSAPDISGKTDRPVVWALLGHRAGDNLQVRALAADLGWPVEIKTLAWQKNRLKRLPRWTPFYGRSASLKHLTPEAKEAFRPPWPDVVLSIGWRSVPIARWIKMQSGARLVHLGRPRAPLASFDLVLTTPQYRLPSAANVVNLVGPLTAWSREASAASIEAWEARFAHLPRPWTVVLVGGDTPTLKFSPAAAAALADAANEQVASRGGALLVVTSPRTPEAVTNVLRETIKEPAYFHQWREHVDNPYVAALGLADHFIVTNDSISMTHEASLTGRPVHIFPLPSKENLRTRVRAVTDRKIRSGNTVLKTIYLALVREGLVISPRFPGDFFNLLVDDGRAAFWGNTAYQSEPRHQNNERAIQAVQTLVNPVIEQDL